MDPISAIGVAAAVVAFDDFGLKVANAAEKAHHSATGSVEENESVEQMKNRLIGIVHELQQNKVQLRTMDHGSSWSQSAKRPLGSYHNCWIA
jgi:hypothetical protein